MKGIFDEQEYKPDENDESDAGAQTRPRFAQRIGGILDKAEAVYLRVLRATVLVIATVLMVYAAWLGITSLFKISQSPDSVRTEVANVSADEIITAEMPRSEVTGSDGQKTDAGYQQYYADFVKRYYGLFQNKFEPFRQPDDKSLTEDEFDDSFLNTSERLNQVQAGKVSFEADKADVEALLTVMTEASDRPLTQQRLKQYQSAKKVAVSTKVQRTRTTQRRGWNPLSMNCENWMEPPMGCPETRTAQVPYTETVTKMELPQGTQSHAQIFRAFQDKYLQLLEERRKTNADRAERERRSIVESQLEGQSSLRAALSIAGGFLLLMFFFLFIAIERHQRRLVTLLDLNQLSSSSAEN